MNVETWEDLAKRIMALPEKQRRQPIQCCPPGEPRDGKPIEMLPGIALATVGHCGLHAIRTTHDNRYHAGDVILLLDRNLFGQDGVIAHIWTGNVASPDVASAVYGRGGPTKPEDQMAPVVEAKA